MNIYLEINSRIKDLPDWITLHKSNSSLVAIYLVLALSNIDFTQLDLPYFNEELTPNRVMSFLKLKGIKVSVPDEITHFSSGNDFKKGRLTFLTYSKPSFTNGIRMSIIKKYDEMKNKVILLEDWNERGFEFSELTIHHYFVADINIDSYSNKFKK